MLTRFSCDLNTKAIRLKKDLHKKVDKGKMSNNFSKEISCVKSSFTLPFQNCLATLQRYYVNFS